MCGAQFCVTITGVSQAIIIGITKIVFGHTSYVQYFLFRQKPTSPSRFPINNRFKTLGSLFFWYALEREK